MPITKLHKQVKEYTCILLKGILSFALEGRMEEKTYQTSKEEMVPTIKWQKKTWNVN